MNNKKIQQLNNKPYNKIKVNLKIDNTNNNKLIETNSPKFIEKKKII